ncbi:MAG: TolC family protein [Planctomycetes bacterium]|nr:TolC family protein [Planctomycetota bacterium]
MKTIYSVVVLLVMAGCASGLQKGNSVAVLAKKPPAIDAAPTATIARVDYEENSAPDEKTATELSQPQSIAEVPANAAEVAVPRPLPSPEGLTMEVLEQMALANSPAISQVAARVRALQGLRLQVGLPPNPSVGYVASEVGNEGAAGQQGGFVGQTFITAGKLQKNRAIITADINRAEQQLAAMHRRVQTDLRKGYYSALLAQRRVQLAEKLVRVTTDAATASKSLYDAEEIPMAGLLQTEVQQQNAQVLLRTAQNGLSQSWRRLSTIVGGEELSVQPLVGDVSQLPESLDWQNQLARLQSESPEIAAAMASIERARRALSRASVEAVPNINAQLSVQYDDATDDTISGVQIGIPLPLWNRNQGGIRQAQAEVSRAIRNVKRVELRLNQRLADSFLQYSDAHVTATTYATDILPRAKRTFDLVQQGYAQGEVGYLDLLIAQQTFSQTNLAYLDALGSLWQSFVQIDGLLLDESLAQQPN